jgi:hypothetical protein
MNTCIRVYRLREQKKRNDFHNREVIKLTQLVHQLRYDRSLIKVRLSYELRLFFIIQIISCDRKSFLNVFT